MIVVLIISIFVVGFICAFLIDIFIRFIHKNFYIYTKTDYERKIAKIISNNKLNIKQMTDELYKVDKMIKNRTRKDKLKKLKNIK